MYKPELNKCFIQEFINKFYHCAEIQSKWMYDTLNSDSHLILIYMFSKVLVQSDCKTRGLFVYRHIVCFVVCYVSLARLHSVDNQVKMKMIANLNRTKSYILANSIFYWIIWSTKIICQILPFLLNNPF